MTFRNAKIAWARKILRAKYFVVLTDKEGVIAFEGVDPKNINDIIAISAQSAELKLFRKELDDLIKRHDKEVKAKHKEV